MIEAFVNLLQHYDEGDGSEYLLNMIFVSCISADTLVDVESCQNSKKVLEDFKIAVQNADVGHMTKTDWSKRIEEGLDIVNRDLQEFQSCEQACN
jgi:hypothetical protein